MDVSEKRGVNPPKSSILIGFSIIKHPFWGIPIFGNTHIYTYISTSIFQAGCCLNTKGWCFFGHPKQYHPIFRTPYLEDPGSWWFQGFFNCSPRPGEMIQFDFFQMGGNHQLILYDMILWFQSMIVGQIIATSHHRFSWGQDIPLFQANLAWWNILIWLDDI